MSPASLSPPEGDDQLDTQPNGKQTSMQTEEPNGVFLCAAKVKRR